VFSHEPRSKESYTNWMGYAESEKWNWSWNQHTLPTEVRHFQHLLAGLPTARRLLLTRDHIPAPEALTGAPTIQPAGNGVASVLADLGLNDRDTFDAIQQDLRSVVPAFSKVHLPLVDVPQGGDLPPARGYTVEFVMNHGGRLAARHVSEGTILALGLLTAAHTSRGPTVLLIDDIDKGLHPQAQARLVACIRALQQSRPDLQVICTTHSPYLVDLVAPEEVRVMALDANGHAVCRALTDHPEYAAWKGLPTGELWSTLGEDWAIGAGDG
jgi:hypothetical protein